MGIDHVDYGLSHWKKMISSTCKLFTTKDVSYVQIGDVVKSGGIKAVYEYIKELGFEEKFGDMILFDSIVMNTDRHYGNFGLLRNNKTGEFIDLAPIFDNGESLLSKALPDIFDNKNKFIEYIKRDEVNVSYYGISYVELVKNFCSKNHIKKLKKLLNFKLQKHSSYNLSLKRINCLNLMIQERARMFIETLNKLD